mmetsp:Transcript_35907/g.86753  ORF Transcript_35907/g.86753 Transcript_35907/m.86753 type:complete len:239 (+) Transcript_35907:316-1032(+)
MSKRPKKAASTAASKDMDDDNIDVDFSNKNMNEDSDEEGMISQPDMRTRQKSQGSHLISPSPRKKPRAAASKATSDENDEEIISVDMDSALLLKGDAEKSNDTMDSPPPLNRHSAFSRANGVATSNAKNDGNYLTETASSKIVCEIEGSTNQTHTSRGLCKTHDDPNFVCKIEGCSQQEADTTSGLCRAHDPDYACIREGCHNRRCEYDRHFCDYHLRLYVRLARKYLNNLKKNPQEG